MRSCPPPPLLPHPFLIKCILTDFIRNYRAELLKIVLRPIPKLGFHGGMHHHGAPRHTYTYIFIIQEKTSGLLKNVHIKRQIDQNSN